MAYITKADFTEYTSTQIPDEDFKYLAERASELIDIITGYKIPGAGGLDSYSQFVKEQVTKATCAQVETLYAQGGNDTLVGWGAENNISSVGIGKFSYSSGNSTNTNKEDELKTLNGTPLSPLLNGYLLPTGLLYRGVACRG